jgi:hypothetical protein
MSGTDKIKGRIRKLLALSKSPNPHEAASALEMAQKLMEEYRIDRGGIGAIEIGEEAARTAYRENPPLYEDILIGKIAKAFGCRTVYHLQGTSCRWKFVGLKHRAQAAAFIAETLLRKLKNARAEYTKTLYRVRSRFRKTQRADDFCTSWVCAVAGKLSAFAGPAPEEEKEIDRFIRAGHPNLTDLNPARRTFGNADDYLRGKRAGEGVALQHGVGAAGAPLAIGGGAWT